MIEAMTQVTGDIQPAVTQTTASISLRKSAVAALSNLQVYS